MIFHLREFFIMSLLLRSILLNLEQDNAVQCNFYSKLNLEQYEMIPKTFLEINLIFPINLFIFYFNLL